MNPSRTLTVAVGLTLLLEVQGSAGIRLGDVEATALATVPSPTEFENLAASELAGYFERIGGQKLKRVEITGSEVPPGTIAVGRLATRAGLIRQEELVPLARDGFVIRVAGGRGAICGYRDVGTVYGVYRFLEHLGVRFFAPGCEKIPQKPNLMLADAEWSNKPFFEYRIYHRHGSATYRMPNLKLGHTLDEEMGDPSAIGEPGGWDHSSAFLVPYKTYNKSHPEYFALMKDGTRLHPIEGKPFNVHLCLSNPDVRRIATERTLMLMEKQPERMSFTVSQGDGNEWCECDKCKAMDAKPGVDMTDRFVDFANEIARATAKKHPDKRILIIAYNDATSRPPTKIMPEPNITIAYCSYPPRSKCQQHDLTCELNRPALEDIEGWLKCCPGRIGIFDYPCAYHLSWQPYTSFYTMKSKMDYYVKLDIRWIGYCMATASFLDLFNYVQGKQSWNPNIDIEPVIDEFMAEYYGPAAKPMREYLAYYHQEVKRRDIHVNCEASTMKQVTPEYADHVLALLDRAIAAAADDPEGLARVELEKFYVLWSDVQHNRPGKSKTVKPSDYVVRLAEAVRLAKKLNPTLIGSNPYPKSMNVWLKDIAKVDIATKPWYDDPWVKKLLADPQSALK
jgi:hypothetical protein